MNNSFITFSDEEQYIQGSGAAFIFYGQNGIDNINVSSNNASAILYNSNPGSEFGFAVAGAGDLNNDNYDDIIVGAPGIDRAYIYYGNETIYMNNNTGFKSPSALGSFNEWANATYAYVSNNQYANSTVTSNSKQDYCNFSFGLPAGIIIQGIEVQIEARAPFILNSELGIELSYNGGTTFSPYLPKETITSATDRIYIYGGPDNTWGRTWTSSEFSNENFTIRLKKYPNPNQIVEVDHLQIKVFYGKYQEIILEATPGEGFGRAVSGGGDVNGDGKLDVIIGAPLNNSEKGSAYLFSYNNWNASTHLYTYSDANVTLIGENPGDLFGYTVKSDCDFNADIYTDIFIGAPNASSNGKIYGFYGGTSTPSQILAANADYNVAGEYANDQFGWSITTSGNFDTKWYDDIIVGAPEFDYTGTTGKTYLLTYDKILDINWVKTFDQAGFEDTTFIAGETIVIQANISGPFGAYDISYANITIRAPDNSILVDDQQMTLEQQDPHAYSFWRRFNFTFNNPNVIGMYKIDINVVGSNNVETDQMTTYDLEKGPLHQILITPSSVNIVAGQSLNFAAQGYDEYNNFIDLTGTIWTTTVGSFSATTNTDADLCAQTTIGQGYVNATSIAIIGSAVVNIIPEGLDHIIVSPNEANITVGTAQEFTAVGYDKYNNIVSITPIWESNIGSMENCVFNAPTKVGSGYVNASYSGLIGSAKVNITPGALDKIVITPSSVIVEVGKAQEFAAVGYDQYNNIITIEPVWTTTVGIMYGSNLTAQANSVSGGFVNATASNITTSAIVTIIPGPLHHLVISPENAVVSAGDHQEFTAFGYDVYGNPVAINPIWNTNVGQMSGSTLMVQITIGTGIVTASYSGINSIANVTIIPGELDYIFIVPQFVEVVIGHQQEFTAYGYDKYNNLIEIDPVWYTDIGVMVGNILYAQTVPGEGSVTATVNLTTTQQDIIGIAQV
ncbi:MAG: FG-GAP repeat protein, partial [Thermoplasmata archaeon]|nr:FG-GAP repeat protein [Thermoplasmata archaeon]